MTPLELLAQTQPPSQTPSASTGWFIVVVCIAVAFGLTIILAAIFGRGRFFKK